MTNIRLTLARLDKVVTITLRMPPYPPDEWVESPMYQDNARARFFMPWAADVPGTSEGVLYDFDLRFFTHMCKVRQLHSEILTYARGIAPAAMLQYLLKMRPEIDRWAKSDEVFADEYILSLLLLWGFSLSLIIGAVA